MENSSPLTEALFYILLAVRTPNHGYGIIQDINEMTGGRVVLGPGTLYGAINSMLTKGWISLYSEDKESRKKKEYLLTKIGREIFEQEVNRLNELVENAKKMAEEKEMRKC
ncbi:Transcriptional regulator, PadR family [Desulfosporosinus sp. I2]|uniref:PadR family transcriptional regulator n=1 Tax=Desulfosporosinus sp. I2 TaxID=1617025 RepID=UPI0005EECEEE|nr:helix-turn-helix transcriptional regulator [Desulfosporosinus sp. I2]KJR45291.1 Transcriptional regulator, PadR family [Desulfosporosinus sp. I2]